MEHGPVIVGCLRPGLLLPALEEILLETAPEAFLAYKVKFGHATTENDLGQAFPILMALINHACPRGTVFGFQDGLTLGFWSVEEKDVDSI